jgi:hypothetical protein
MNERIRELEQMSWEELGEEECYYTVFNAEKFAELIIRECMMLVEGFESTQEVALDEYVDYEASAVLKEHFGVEE